MRKEPEMVLGQHPLLGDWMAVSGLSSEKCHCLYKRQSRTVSDLGSDNDEIINLENPIISDSENSNQTKKKVRKRVKVRF